MLFIFYYSMKNGAWKANIPKIYKYLLQDEQNFRSLQYMRQKWSEMLCVHCIEKPVGLFDQWFCMNICISFIGDCKSNCSRDKLNIYIYRYGCNIVLCYQYINAPRSNYRGHIVFVLFLYARLHNMVWWCLSVHPSGSPSIRLSVRLKLYIWLSFTVLQIKFECRQFASIFVGFMPLLELRILEVQFSALFSYMLWHIELKFFIWLSLMYYRSSLSVVTLCPAILAEI